MQVVGLAGVTSISNSSTNGCAVLDGGALRCWGLMGCGINECLHGQLGTGTNESSLVPVPVMGFENGGGRSVSAGGSTTCAARDDGTAWCWGSNHSGALGAGSSFYISPTPLQVAFPE